MEFEKIMHLSMKNIQRITDILVLVAKEDGDGLYVCV